MLMPVKRTFAYYFYLLWILFNVINVSKGRSPPRARIPCPIPDSIPNGSYRIRKNNMIMRIMCMPGYQLQGDRTIECVNGKWKGERRICAKPGCHIDVPNPEHGHILMDKDVRMVLFCLDFYTLAGNRFAYCNGTHWDREIGDCRELSFNVDHDCDFETEEICGWEAEETIGTHWRRVMAANIYTSYHTGPRHDHTTMSDSGGHYMLMETIEQAAEPALLLSPIYERDLSLKTACCFRFYYFMYGIGVGDLKVYVRPITKSVKNVLSSEEFLRFHMSGNQNNSWNEAHFNVSELDDDFQIVFVATAGHNHLSDIAIDDVKLMTGEDCKELDKPADDYDEPTVEEVTGEVLIDTQSCRGRCREETGAGYVRRFNQLYGRCNCHAECEEDESCCPDFQSICLNEMFDQSTQINGETTNELFETTIKIVPTTSTTTTKAAPTTTTTLKTTTTRTTTTPRPTTKTLRTTTTTKIMTSTKRTTTTLATTTSTTVKPTPFTTPRVTMPTTTKTTTKPTKKTTTTSTTPKPTTKIIYFWDTATTTNKTTIKSRTSPTSTNSRSTSTTTTTLQPETMKINTFERPTGRPSIVGKKEIVSWNIDNSRKEFKSPAKAILLAPLILLLIIIVISAAYYRHKQEIRSFLQKYTRGGSSSTGDVETTTIRAKFLNRLSTSSKIIGIKSRLGFSSNRGSDDLNCLVDGDNDFDNDGSVHVDNPSHINKARVQKSSLSTNL